jgi:hypothetical protein
MMQEEVNVGEGNGYGSGASYHATLVNPHRFRFLIFLSKNASPKSLFIWILIH